MSNLPQLQHRATYQQIYFCANHEGFSFHLYLLIRRSYYSLSQEQGESEHITHTNHGDARASILRSPRKSLRDRGGYEHRSRIRGHLPDVQGRCGVREKSAIAKYESCTLMGFIISHHNTFEQAQNHEQKNHDSMFRARSGEHEHQRKPACDAGLGTRWRRL